MGKRIAIVGSGISGLSAAWLLSKEYTVVIYEANEYVGGHCHTVEAKFDDEVLTFDTGFMVYNEQGYPELTRFFSYLDVPTKPADMSFSVSVDDGQNEWAANGWSGLFANWKNLFKPSFYRFLLEIVRFNKVSHQELQTPATKEDFTVSIEEFLNTHKFSERFRNLYLYPMGSLIWSAPKGTVKQFPIRMVQEFLSNHNLLTTSPTVVWKSVVGGSKTYVKIVIEQIKVNGGIVHLETPVRAINRENGLVTITTHRGEEKYDAVVIAAHADTTLKLLSDPTVKEKTILSKFKYQKNKVIAHGDKGLMPKRKRAWAAWNFCDVVEGSDSDEMSLTYHMNVLNDFDSPHNVFVTINPARIVDRKKIYSTFNYAHPLQNANSRAAQLQMAELQGQQNTYFSGCYFGYGFHEDGFVAGKQVAEYFDCHVPWQT